MSSPNFNEFIEKFVLDRKQEITNLEEELEDNSLSERRTNEIMEEIKALQTILKPNSLLNIATMWLISQPQEVSRNKNLPMSPPMSPPMPEQQKKTVNKGSGIKFSNRVGNVFARAFNPVPGIGFRKRAEDAAARLLNPQITGVTPLMRAENAVSRTIHNTPIEYRLENAVATRFNPAYSQVREQLTAMLTNQRLKIESTISSLKIRIETTANEQSKKVLNALKTLLEKILQLNVSLAEYLSTYEFIPTWVIFTISNLSYLVTLVLMFYFFFSMGQSVVLALIIMKIGHSFFGIGKSFFGKSNNILKQTLETTGVAAASRAMYNVSVGEAHRSAAKVAEEERKEDEVSNEEQAETVAQAVQVFQTEAPDLQARHRAWLMYALRSSDAAKGAAEAAQAAYKAAKEAGKSDDEADAAADFAGEEAAERITPKLVKQTAKDLEIGGLVGAIGGGIMGLFEACGIGRTRRPPRSAEENAALGEAEWAKIEPLLQDPFMKQERIRVNQLSDEDLQTEIEETLEENPDSINIRGIIIDGDLIHRRMAEIKLLTFLSKQRWGNERRRVRNRTRKAKCSSRKSRKNRRN
jgi:hypothetical protein